MIDAWQFSAVDGVFGKDRYLGDNELVEFVYDTTDVVRDVLVEARELLRGVVCLDARYLGSVAKLGTYLKTLAA